MPERAVTGLHAAGPVLAVVGPTAVGKSELAEALALRIGGEIVSADSMQVYRGMDIGTAKAAPSSRRVPYHLVDVLEPGQPYSAALFQRDARAAIDAILARGTVPVIVGGTGLYMRAALDVMDFPSGDVGSPARESYERLAAELGARGLHDRLAALDPEAAALIHRNNTRRVIRALEMLEHDGVSYAAQAARFSERRGYYRSVLVGLTCERSHLYARIDARVDAMIAAGLLDEVRSLLDRGYRTALTASQAIGYKELVPVIEDGVPLDTAVEQIKRASRRYGKRQLTWFTADPRVIWLDVTDLSPEQAADAAWGLVESVLRPAVT